MTKHQQEAARIQAQLGGLWGRLTAVGEWLSYSEAWKTLLGLASLPPLLDMLHPADHANWHTAVETATPDSPATFELRLHHPSQNSYHHYQCRLAPLPPSADSEQTFAFQAWELHAPHNPPSQPQHEEHALLQAILQTSIGAIIVLDTAGQITFANQRAEEILGLNRSDLTTRTYDDPNWRPTDLDGGPWPDESQPFRIVMDTQQPVFDIRHAIEWPDGQRKALSINGAPLHDENGQLTGAVFLVHDITTQLAVERNLRESETLFRGIVESQIDLVSRYKPDTTLLYVNEAYCEYFGYSREELIGRSFLFMVAEDEKEKVYARLDELRRDPATPRTLVTRDSAIDGHNRWVQWTDYGLTDKNGELHMVQAVGRDVTELKQLEMALRDSQHRLSTLISNLPGLVYRCENNLDWRMHFISDGVQALTGYTPEAFITGEVSLGSLIEPEWRETVFNEVQIAIKEDRPYELVYQLRHRQGELHWVWERGRAVSRHPNDPQVTFLEGFITDITEQKRAEEILLQSQKAESLGVLAGGIAHDFNNLLVAILGQSSLALNLLNRDAGAARKPIGKVVKAAKRASDLTRQLLAYSGQGQLQVQALDLNELLQENTHLLQVAVSHRVELVLDLAEDLPPIMADAGQIQQIAMNLVLNAAEAIGEASGTVAIHTAVRHVAENSTFQSRWMEKPLAAGQFVELQVSDNGLGMSQETMERIFDPFFSTKFTGRGLGLSAVAGIINSHHGGIDVSSTPSVGTTFTLLFPAATSAEAPDTAVVTPHLPDLATLSGTIMIIDDEQLVREAVQDMLTPTNLMLIEAADGYSGLDLFRRYQATVDLILLDISMPQLSGFETLKLLREIDPDVPIVLSSGYQNALPSLNQQDVTALMSDFMQKPYQPEQLYQLLTRYLRLPELEETHDV